MKCEYCGKEFKKRRGNQIYCSEKCRQTIYNVKPYSAYLEREPNTCEYCGIKFKPQFGSGFFRYCSGRCKRLNNTIKLRRKTDFSKFHEDEIDYSQKKNWSRFRRRRYYSMHQIYASLKRANIRKKIAEKYRRR